MYKKFSINKEKIIFLYFLFLNKEIKNLIPNRENKITMGYRKYICRHAPNWDESNFIVINKIVIKVENK